MIDYSHIPIHIKCTERWKIDPLYPADGCRWWKLQLNRPEYYAAMPKKKWKIDLDARPIQGDKI